MPNFPGLHLLDTISGRFDRLPPPKYSSHAFDQVLDRAQPLPGDCRQVVEGGDPVGSGLANLDPNMVIGLVVRLGPAGVLRLGQADRDAMATNMANYLAMPQASGRADARQAYDALIQAGAVPALPGQDRSPMAELARAYTARLTRHLSQSGITPNLIQFDVATQPDWNPSPLYRPATAGPDGRGFSTVREAMLGGAGRATQEQNRLTMPFNVEAEHGYVVTGTPQMKFTNIFIRGNAQLAMTARGLVASGAPASEQALAIDSYRFGSSFRALVQKLIGEGRSIAAVVHTHPRSTGSEAATERTNEFPSAPDLLGALHMPEPQRAVVFSDANGRLSIAVFSAQQVGQRLDVRIESVQNAERRDASG